MRHYIYYTVIGVCVAVLLALNLRNTKPRKLTSYTLDQTKNAENVFLEHEILTVREITRFDKLSIESVCNVFHLAKDYYFSINFKIEKI